MNYSSMDRSVPHQPIVGYVREMKALSRWLETVDAVAQIFAVSGIGGIGKTTLLTEMAALSRRSEIRTLWVDGQVCLHTPGALLTHLDMCLETEYGSVRGEEETLMAHVLNELSHQRTVILIDNCESLERIESWLLGSLLPRLAQAPCLLVMASRPGLPLKWHIHPAWADRIETFPLELFTREQIYEYLHNSGLPLHVQQNVAHRTGGHPLLLALTVDMMRRQGEDILERSSQLPRILSAELLQEVSDPFMYEALQLLALFPAADQMTLNQLLERSLSASDYASLSRLSCIRMVPGGLALHQLLGRILREDYELRNPREYKTMRLRALRLLIEQYPAADKLRQMQLAAHVLELYREQLPAAHQYVDFSGIHQQERRRGINAEDMPYLHRFLATSISRSDWQSELVEEGAHHQLLDDIALYSPESILVTRDNNGIPLAFSAGLWLHARTLPLLERYAPAYLQVLGEEADLLRRLPPEAADTMCMLLAAVDIEQPYHRPEELGAMLFQSWLIEATSGLRAIIATADQQMNMLLPLMGFQQNEETSLEQLPWASMMLWELDLRQATFEVWVERIIQQTTQATKIVHASEIQPLPWTEVKRLLQHLYDDTLLETQTAVREMGMKGAGLREQVQYLLTTAPPPYPLTELEQHILRESYLYKYHGKSQLAEAFHMSRTTFYRHSKQAITHLGHVLARTARERNLHNPDADPGHVG